MFLLGGGFAVAEASKVSGMSELIADSLHSFAMLPQFYVMAITCIMASLVTQLAANVSVATVILPVLSEIAVVSNPLITNHF